MLYILKVALFCRSFLLIKKMPILAPHYFLCSNVVGKAYISYNNTMTPSYLTNSETRVKLKNKPMRDPP